MMQAYQNSPRLCTLMLERVESRHR